MRNRSLVAHVSFTKSASGSTSSSGVLPPWTTLGQTVHIVHTPDVSPIVANRPENSRDAIGSCQSEMRNHPLSFFFFEESCARLVAEEYFSLLIRNFILFFSETRCARGPSKTSSTY